MKLWVDKRQLWMHKRALADKTHVGVCKGETLGRKSPFKKSKNCKKQK